MEFVDVVFPVNLGPLTYRCPEAFSDSVKPGMIVSAPLRNRTGKGILLGKSPTVPKSGIRDILSLHGEEPVLSRRLIELLKWMSDYYMAEQGIVLKTMLPREAFMEVKKKKPVISCPDPENGMTGDEIPDSAEIVNIANIMHTQSLNRNMYRTFLVHAPSSQFELSLLRSLLVTTGNAIILVPEVSLIGNVYHFLAKNFGKRVCQFHGHLSRSQKSATFNKIAGGFADIIVGTRSAVFAPLKRVSLIAVLQEHSSSYKQENMPCYHARDVAVMRGYLEKTTVLLSSVCPSIESFFNCTSGKYTMLNPSDDMKKPRIKVIDMRYEKQITPSLSKNIIDAALKHVNNDRRVIFVLNRRGYATLLQCMDCSHMEECPECRIPLVFHKQDLSMKCHYCGYTLPHPPESCSRCRGYNLVMLGSGTQRVAEELGHIMGISTVRIDSDRARGKSALQGLLCAADLHDNKLLIGTRLMTKRLKSAGNFSMAAFLNTDQHLNLPDFRSAEKAYQEISSVMDTIESDGEIFIQTRMPGNYLFKYLKAYDHRSFCREELIRRKELCYPPFSRLVLIRVIAQKDIAGKLCEFVGTRTTGDMHVEILGPHLSKNKQGKNEYKFLLKSGVRENLRAAAASFIETFRNSRDVRVKIDVDPTDI